MPKKFWEVKNSADEGICELLIYGNLSDSTWWGDEVTPTQFNNDLEKLENVKELRVRINSYGGDVFAGHSILNSIKNFKKKNDCLVKTIVDGVAASAASVVLQAGDQRIVPSNTMVMVHDPAIGVCGYINEAKLKQYMDALIPIKESIIEAYHERSGKDKLEIANIMKDETWMTAAKAIELGFADQLDEDIDLDVQMKSDHEISINNVVIDCTQFQNMPMQFMNMAKKPVENQNHQQVGKQDHKEEKIVNLEDLKTKHPEIYNEVYNAGKKAGSEEERARIKSIENLARPGSEELLNKAKFETPMNAGDLAVQLIEADKAKNVAANQNMQKDAEVLNGVEAQEGQQTDEKEEEETMINNLVNLMNN